MMTATMVVLNESIQAVYKYRNGMYGMEYGRNIEYKLSSTLSIVRRHRTIPP